MANDRFIKQIQSSLAKKKDDDGKRFSTVSYSKIREVIANEFVGVDPENMSENEKKDVVNFIHQKRLEQRQALASPTTADTSASVTTQTVTHEIASTETTTPEEETEPVQHSTHEPEQPPAPLAVADKKPLATQQTTELGVQETSITNEKLAPQEAVAIIQEIAADNTSSYKLMASELLQQLDSRTDSIVKLIEAAPEIEAEMLRRKLKNASRKSVDYDAVVTEHFRQSSSEINDYLSGIASEFGIAI